QDRHHEPGHAEALLLVALLELLLAREHPLQIVDLGAARDTTVVGERRGVREAAGRTDDFLDSCGGGHDGCRTSLARLPGEISRISGGGFEALRASVLGWAGKRNQKETRDFSRCRTFHEHGFQSRRKRARADVGPRARRAASAAATVATC